LKFETNFFTLTYSTDLLACFL